MIRNLPEHFKVVQLTGPVTSNGGVTSDYISLKNANKVWIVVDMNQAAAHATLLTPKQASAVDGTGAKALTNNINIWANEDTASADTLTKQTAAKNYTVTADIKKKQIVFEIDPVGLDLANSFDCINLVVADSSEATNFVNATAYIDTKYKEDVPPAAITD